LERIIEALKQNNINIEEKKTSCDVFLVTLGEEAKKKSLRLNATLNANGIFTLSALGRGNIKAQLKHASRVNAKIALIIGQKEVFDGSVIVRDMVDRSQEVVPFVKAIDFIKNKLKNR